MTEAETLTALAAIAEAIASYIGLWVTTTFAYLTVAYLVGKNLTRFQAGAVTGLYVIASSLFALSAMANSEAWLTTAANSDTVYRTVSVSKVFDVWLPGMWFIVFSALCVSLYFMYDVRNRKPETHGSNANT